VKRGSAARLVALVVCGVLLPASANAVVVLTLDNDGIPSYQQQDSVPCVVGGPSCHNPGGFGYTNINSADDDTVVTAAEGTSPLYTVGQIRTLIGDFFSVGIDTNQAGKKSGDRIVLDSFELKIDGTSEFTYTGPTSINLVQGNGFSDAVLLGFDLSPFDAALSAQFVTAYSNATSGAESFFLVAAGTPPASLPEPGVLALVGIALTGIAVVRRRRRV
jgi:hypothetical protein